MPKQFVAAKQLSVAAAALFVSVSVSKADFVYFKCGEYELLNLYTVGKDRLKANGRFEVCKNGKITHSC